MVQAELARWRELNLAADFQQACAKLVSFSRSLPLLVHHQVPLWQLTLARLWLTDAAAFLSTITPCRPTSWTPCCQQHAQMQCCPWSLSWHWRLRWLGTYAQTSRRCCRGCCSTCLVCSAQVRFSRGALPWSLYIPSFGCSRSVCCTAGCVREPTALQAIFDCLAAAVRAVLKPLASQLPDTLKATRGFWAHEAERVRQLAGQALAPLLRRAPERALRKGIRALVAGMLSRVQAALE